MERDKIIMYCKKCEMKIKKIDWSKHKYHDIILEKGDDPTWHRNKVNSRHLSIKVPSGLIEDIRKIMYTTHRYLSVSDYVRQAILTQLRLDFGDDILRSGIHVENLND